MFLLISIALSNVEFTRLWQRTHECHNTTYQDHVNTITTIKHDDVIKWEHFPCNWTFVRRIHRSPVNSPYKGQWRGALIFSLICACLNKRLSKQSRGWRFETPSGSYDVNVMQFEKACTANWLDTNHEYFILIITRDSEGIMFSPWVFVCVSVYVCHDVWPDDLTMKDWCHTKNILQVHCWGCLVVQIMFHALMTSLMTSQDHTGQILKLIYLRHNLRYSVDQKLKMSGMLMAIFLVYSTSGITSGTKVCCELKMAAILKILKY